MTPRTRAELVLFGVTVAWGGSFLVVKESLATFSPFTLVALRFGIATTLLALAFRGRALALGGDAAAGARWSTSAWIGGLLFAAFAFQTLGLRFTTPARSGFITATYVAMVPLLARLVLGRAVRKRVLAAVLAAIVGLFLLTGVRGGGANAGDFLTLLSALAFAAHMIALERWSRELPPAAFAFAQMAAVTLLAAPLALALEVQPSRVGAGAWLGLAYLGVICTAVGFLAQTWGQRHTSPTRTGLIFSLESLFAALLSVALGAEVLTPLQWLGGLLLVAGVIVGELPDEPETGGGDATSASSD